MAASPWRPSSMARRPCSSTPPVRAPPGFSSLCPAAVEFPARAPSPYARSRLGSNSSELGPCILPAVASMAPSSDFCLVARRFLVSWSRPAVFCQGCSYTHVLIPLLAVGPTISSSPAMSLSMTPSTGVSPSVCWPPRRALYRHGADARILHLHIFWMSAQPLSVVGLISTLLVHTSHVRNVVTCLLASSERPGEEILEGLYGKDNPYAAMHV
ncbi:hypothetical protein ZEAMMB73_Zm00001d041107 [Zea mays]|uniref:Uncharacterized protein n=1 Tax=Zea mays TaxID=4577 RepID=A0A1D6MUC1_MAIZE|nr:hypothetical protein ZEAMMB73_Zm00001d041107 [Zea mays]